MLPNIIKNKKQEINKKKIKNFCDLSSVQF